MWLVQVQWRLSSRLLCHSTTGQTEEVGTQVSGIDSIINGDTDTPQELLVCHRRQMMSSMITLVDTIIYEISEDDCFYYLNAYVSPGLIFQSFNIRIWKKKSGSCAPSVLLWLPCSTVNFYEQPLMWNTWHVTQLNMAVFLTHTFFMCCCLLLKNGTCVALYLVPPV